MRARTHCPSCQYRLSPFAAECPVCGLALAVRDHPRPLLFQASLLQGKSPAGVQASAQAISTPAFGRVPPLPVTSEEATSTLAPVPSSTDITHPKMMLDSSFWPLVKMEVGEFLVIFLLNGLFGLLACLLSGMSPVRLYGALWLPLFTVHAALSWTYIMLPMALTGQSIMMSRKGLLLDASQADRRLAFSLFHLVSVCCWPLSFLCLVLTPNHRTLAELLTGQEILQRSVSRMR